MKKLTGDITCFAQKGRININTLKIYNRLEDYEDLNLAPNEVRQKLKLLEDFENIGHSPRKIQELLGMPPGSYYVRCKECVFWKKQEAPECKSAERRESAESNPCNAGYCLIFTRRNNSRGWYENFHCSLGIKKIIN